MEFLGAAIQEDGMMSFALFSHPEVPALYLQVKHVVPALQQDENGEPALMEATTVISYN